jgi:hypothetical protein
MPFECAYRGVGYGMVREARTVPTEIAKEALNRECFLYETFYFIHNNVYRCQLDV